MPSRNEILSEGLIPLLPEQYRALVELPTLEHALWLGSKLREADLLEIRAATGRDGTASLIVSARSSAIGWTFLHPGNKEPFAMAGLVLMENIPGIPWAVAVPWDKESLRFFMDVYATIINYMHNFAPEMRNFVDARNHQACRWLQKAGFTLGEPLPWGKEQLLFYEFTKGF